jgi:hypothetical protein
MANMSVLARDQLTGQIVHISDVEEGYEHAICDACKSKLDAANHYRSTRKVAFYFRHRSGGGGCSSMTMLHEYAQQIVRDQGAIQLPDFEACVYPRNPKNDLEPLEFYRKGYLANLLSPSLEKTYPTERKFIADVHGAEPEAGDLYVEIRVHNEVNDEKQAALRNAGLDVIQVDLRSLVDQQGLTKEQIQETVIFSAPREWISQRRFENDLLSIRKQMHELELPLASERGSARLIQEEKGLKKKDWRRRHSSELGLIEAYAEFENRRLALNKFWEWCQDPKKPEYTVYRGLTGHYGKVPPIVNIPVKGELAFRAHRTYWQTLIFEGVILKIYDDQMRKIAQHKRKNRRFYYGDEIAWLSDMPSISPTDIYKFLMKRGVPLTTLARTFEEFTEGEPLAEKYGSRPESLRFVTVKEYSILPKPVPAIRRYLKVLSQIGVLSASNDTFFIPFQSRPETEQSVPNYEELAREGFAEYG